MPVSSAGLIKRGLTVTSFHAVFQSNMRRQEFQRGRGVPTLQVHWPQKLKIIRFGKKNRKKLNIHQAGTNCWQCGMNQSASGNTKTLVGWLLNRTNCWGR